MSPELRDRFDKLLEDVLDSLPASARAVIEEVPVIVLDRPDPAMIRSLRQEGVLPPREGEPPDGGPSGDDDDLMGLHSGVAITEASIDGPAALPGQIHVFREAIVEHAGGWDQEHADDEIYEEIRVTLLHEIGHHFGLDEDDLEDLGYG